MTRLDRIVCALALRRARELVAEGWSADRAAEAATPGAWSCFRRWVRCGLG